MDNKQELKENKEARDELENFYLLKIRQEQDTEQKILLIEDMARYFIMIWMIMKIKLMKH